MMTRDTASDVRPPRQIRRPDHGRSVTAITSSRATLYRSAAPSRICRTSYTLAPETRGIRVTGAAAGADGAVALDPIRRSDLDLLRLQIRAAPPVQHTQTGTRRRKSSHRLDRQRTGFPDGGLQATGNRQTATTRGRQCRKREVVCTATV